jgi:hypothetical protein
MDVCSFAVCVYVSSYVVSFSVVVDTVSGDAL